MNDVVRPAHPTVPREYAGQWIAWNRDLTKIVASSSTAAGAVQRAKDAGELAPVLAKTPPASQRLIGARFA
jgi:hypothetical protein